MHMIPKEDLLFVGSSYRFVGEDHENVAVSIFLLEAQPGRGAPLHIHECDEIVMVKGMRSRLVVADEIREAVACDIIVVKEQTPHGFLNMGDSVLKQIDIHESPFFKQENLQSTEVSRRANPPCARERDRRAARLYTGRHWSTAALPSRRYGRRFGQLASSRNYSPCEPRM